MAKISDEDIKTVKSRRLAPLGQDKEEEEEEIERADLASKVFTHPRYPQWTQQTLQVRKMEEEQEEMGNSLMALTSHYAKVQLRLQQVVAAPNEAREELLKDLEDFAFRGIPNMRPPDMDNKTLCLVS